MEEYVEDEFADGEDESRGPILGQERNVGVQAGRVPSTNANMSQLIAALSPTVEKMPGSSTSIQANRSLQ